MALARIKTWNPGDTLTAADLNSEFNNPLNNPISLISPTTGAINFQTSVLHTNLAPSAIAASSGGGLPAALSIVRGLTGNITASQTATLSADAYLLQTTAAFPTFFPLTSTASFTINVGTAGPAANGRDVAAAFSSTYLHLYAITTGAGSTTPAGIASSTPPPTGPVLPTNYSVWTYLGSFPYSSGSTSFSFLTRVRGASALFEISQNVLNAGGATSEAAVSLVSLLPTNALQAMLSIRNISFRIANNTQGGNFLELHVIAGSTYVSRYPSVSGYPAGTTATQRFPGGEVIIPNVSQQFFYQQTADGGSDTPTTTIDLIGYTMPNGGE